ncbi:hypothetical protein [Microvirga tunisiensis]|uniref:Uncharacterized protein n=1 Tax=Microvirga tunisiensis TaxID=2108360 RepID=A0A5N7MUR4_9HYPH|nr:hypothetical protein [Microvirga tunisiensis]MPR10772.1 hypothetical protein [Microvirga tunisiensis]MPR30628.1 hypothetical protein [Microvirga tunisiensis]
MNAVDYLQQREDWVRLRYMFTSFDRGPAGATKDTQVQTAVPNDQAELVATMTIASSMDAAVRWIYPAPEPLLEAFPHFVCAFGGGAFECQTAYFIGDVQAATLWLTPALSLTRML